MIAPSVDHDTDTTPGLSEGGNEFSVAGAERVVAVIPRFSSGHAVVDARGRGAATDLVS